MSVQDKMICKALDRLHQEIAGLRKPCVWTYNGKTDVYKCEHIALTGKQVISETHQWMAD